MSADTTPITPARFAAALKDLPIASLHLKVLELRNSIAHLDYSNEQLRPFAEGMQSALSSSTAAVSQSGPGRPEPDQDCVDAIAENEAVIARMEERIALVRREVEDRGVSWREFRSKEEVDAEDGEEQEGRQRQEQPGGGEASRNGGAAAANHNGTNTAAAAETHEAWRDGTFQTGTIRNGEVRLNGPSRAPGGTLTDEELRRRVEEQMRNLGTDDEEDGMHL